MLGICLLILSVTGAGSAKAATLEVGPSGYTYTSIQAAINAAGNGDTVLVHDGTYMENINFYGKAITVQSQNGPDVTIIDGGGSGSVVTFNSEEGTDSVLNGFTITDGFSEYYGAGIYCGSNTSPTITNCTITGNSSTYGGSGIWCGYNNASPVIKHCLIYNNTSSSGACIYLEEFSTAIIINCTIADNNGTGLYCYHSSHPQVVNTIFWNNTTEILAGSLASLKLSYCNVKGGYPGLGNINADPQFVNPGSGDYSLGVGSPCIDAGHPRMYDSDTFRSDMGAYGGKGGVDSQNLDLTVDPTGSGENIFNTIQDAIDYSLTGDTITVLPGTYNENLVIAGKTIALIGQDGAGSTIIDGASGSGSVLALANTGFGALVQGFNLRNGNASQGGGISSIDSSPRISYCSITDNSTTEPGYLRVGGGIFGYYGTTLFIDNCTINGNTSSWGGGGIYCDKAIINNCTIDGNASLGDSQSGGAGGGVNGRSIEVNNSTITNNRAEKGVGGGILSSEYVQITNSLVKNNIAKAGGGIFCPLSSSAEISNCEISWNTALSRGRYNYADYTHGGGGIGNEGGSLLIINSIISNNFAHKNGGGIFATSEGDANIINCAFNGNKAKEYGGAISCYTEYLNTNIVNSILWGDTASLGSNEIRGNPTVTYSDIQGGWTGTGNNNINTDPFWVNPTGGDYHLQSVSPCIDAANSDLGTYLDKDKNSRYDDPLTSNTGVGSKGPHFDMGAYEYQRPGGPITFDVGVSGYPYTSIQAAIDEAQNGDTIIVHDGTYTENINFKGKAVTIQSQNGSDVTIIDGGGSGSVVTFNSGEGSESVLSGFTIQNGSATSGGGILCTNASSPSIIKCDIKDNSATNGAGIYCSSSSRPTITNCTITDNASTGMGGGIYSTDNSAPTIINCTITKNSSGEEGGGAYNDCNTASSLTMSNSILWGNLVAGLSDEHTSLFVYGECSGSGGDFSGGGVIITHSDIHGDWPGEGNISIEPSFIDSTNKDYHLQPGSPAIDAAGSDSPAPGTDKEGKPRYDSPAKDNTGSGANGEYYDMGAYEYGSAQYTYYRDADGDTYGNPDIQVASESTSPPTGYVFDNNDCDDTNPNIHLGATESCNLIDDNCDGQTDEGFPQDNTYYLDADGDGYGNLDVVIQGCTAPEGYVSDNTDCNDTNENINPNTTWHKDTDNDGYSDGTTYTQTQCDRQVKSPQLPIVMITMPPAFPATRRSATDWTTTVIPSYRLMKLMMILTG
jgi:parallel beta-helix repeat protein/predicted outer membrane repeat protein